MERKERKRRPTPPLSVKWSRWRRSVTSSGGLPVSDGFVSPLEAGQARAVLPRRQREEAAPVADAMQALSTPDGGRRTLCHPLLFRRRGTAHG